MDDFYVPQKHNFHPKDIIHDIKLLVVKYTILITILEYNHAGSSYFSVGGGINI